jgi:hypothetical protein
MHATCTCSLSGGRRSARKRASSDPTAVISYRAFARGPVCYCASVVPACGIGRESSPRPELAKESSQALVKERLEALLAGLYDGPDEYLTPEEADLLNAHERERVREVQVSLAANPCITFSRIPTVRAWRPRDIKPSGIF